MLLTRISFLNEISQPMLEGLNMKMSCSILLCLRFCCPCEASQSCDSTRHWGSCGIQRGPADRESWSSGLCPNHFETTSLLGIMYPRLLYNESKIWSHLIQSICSQWTLRAHAFESWECTGAYAYASKYINMIFSIAALCQSSTKLGTQTRRVHHYACYAPHGWPGAPILGRAFWSFHCTYYFTWLILEHMGP